ncbi:integrase, partial [Escherichia coli]|nr:integrase [Escherichia coli]
MRWNGTRDLQKNQEKRLIDESPKPLKSVVKFALVTVLRK